MKLASIRFCEDADHWLRHLKSRTRLPANLLCRIGFCLSLNDPMVPDPSEFPADSKREIERHTLTGPYDVLLVALLRERCMRDRLPTEGKEFEEQFRAHMNRGVFLLFHRVKSLSDLCNLVPSVAAEVH
jgi:DNA sulfur modification protein DndE